MSLNKERRQKSGCAAAHPVPPSLGNIKKILGDHVLMSHKPKKEEETPVAVALFEPPDPTKRPMYCKHLVYQGVTEFQFEELRAARYRQKIAKEEVAKVRILELN